MDVQKLAKVLALAASDNDTEALQALRTAKRLLEGEGADFVELARRLTEGAQSDAVGREVLEDAIFDLRNEIRHLRSENERLKQGRGGGPAPAAEPPSFQDAARAARPAPEPEPMQPKVPVAAKQAPRRKAKGAASQFALL